MLFTEPEIEIHFETMQLFAEEIANIAKHLQDITTNDGMRVINDLKRAWICENADAFANKGVKTVNEINDIAQDLKNISDKMNKKAKLLYELEMCNVLTANARIYL